jgi:hypothetical protein
VLPAAVGDVVQVTRRRGALAQVPGVLRGVVGLASGDDDLAPAVVGGRGGRALEGQRGGVVRGDPVALAGVERARVGAERQAGDVVRGADGGDPLALEGVDGDLAVVGTGAHGGVGHEDALVDVVDGQRRVRGERQLGHAVGRGCVRRGRGGHAEPGAGECGGQSRGREASGTMCAVQLCPPQASLSLNGVGEARVNPM